MINAEECNHNFNGDAWVIIDSLESVSIKQCNHCNVVRKIIRDKDGEHVEYS